MPIHPRDQDSHLLLNLIRGDCRSIGSDIARPLQCALRAAEVGQGRQRPKFERRHDDTGERLSSTVPQLCVLPVSSKTGNALRQVADSGFRIQELVGGPGFEPGASRSRTVERLVQKRENRSDPVRNVSRGPRSRPDSGQSSGGLLQKLLHDRQLSARNPGMGFS